MHGLPDRRAPPAAKSLPEFHQGLAELGYVENRNVVIGSRKGSSTGT